MRTIRIKNNTQEEKIWIKSFTPGEEYTLPSENPSLIAKYASLDSLLTAIGNGEALIGDADGYFSTISDQINWLRGDQISVTAQVLSNPAFAAKTVEVNGEVKKLFKRIHGISANVVVGENTILFTIPYTWAKITGTVLIGGEIRDTANLYILDSEAGTYSGVANYTLNQFGFNVNIAKDQHKYESSYDADIYQGMQIKIVYTSISAKTIGINFDLNECKS